MKRKSILGRVAIIAAALTLATTSMMSGTLARYRMSATVGAEAIIAKWDPQIGTTSAHWKEGSSSTAVTIDLTKTINADQSTKINPNDVGNTTSKDRIAPGMGGSTTITIDPHGSEVPIHCTIEAWEKEGYEFPKHLVVTLKDETNNVVGELKAAWTGSSYGGVFTEGGSSGNFKTMVGTSDHPALIFPAKKDGGTSKVYTLEWNWPLDFNDVNGTAGTSKEATESAYDQEDARVGGLAGTTNPFGFELVINLQQQSKGDTGDKVGS